MEFWGIEVKSGQPFDVSLGEGKVLHLSQACLGEVKNNNSDEYVCLRINIQAKNFVLGTLNLKRVPQQLFDLVLDTDFQLSHNWKNGSVYFCGYIADQPFDDSSDSEESDSDEEDEALPVPVANGKQEVKKEENPAVVKQEVKKEESSGVAKKKDGKQKVKIVEPQKDSDEDEANSDDSDSMSDGDSEEDDDDSSDSEDSSSDEEETPKKDQSGKKRPNESAMKTPASDKKAKLSTPQKTEGKKAGGHVATPHPAKQIKAQANKSNQKGQASASTDGEYSCKPCNRTFKSDGALNSHNQAKHK